LKNQNMLKTTKSKHRIQIASKVKNSKISKQAR